MTGSVMVAERPQVTVTPVGPETNHELPEPTIEPVKPVAVEPKKSPEERQRALDDLLRAIKPVAIPEDTHDQLNTVPEESALSNISTVQPPTEKDLRVKRALEDLKARTLSVITSVAEQTAALPNTPMRNIQISELVEKEKRVREILDSVQLK